MITMVVLTYCRGGVALDLLDSLTELDHRMISEIIVVDNNDERIWPDGYFVGKYRDKVSVIADGRNSGVGGGRNRAIEQAANSDFLFVDDDCILGDLTAAYSFIEPGNFAGLINVQVEKDNGDLRPNEIPRPKELALAHAAVPANVCYVIGACFFAIGLTKKEVLFNDRYNPYGFEEIALSFRTIASGRPVVSVTKTSTRHLKSENGRIAGLNQQQSINKFYIVGRYYPLTNLVLTTTAYLIRAPSNARAIIIGLRQGFSDRLSGEVKMTARYLRRIGLSSRLI